jgi:hypothetical protein
VVNAAHLRRILRGYAEYYNCWRTHLSLAKDAPFGRRIHSEGPIARLPQVGGLHQAFVRIQ